MVLFYNSDVLKSHPIPNKNDVDVFKMYEIIRHKSEYNYNICVTFNFKKKFLPRLVRNVGLMHRLHTK